MWPKTNKSYSRGRDKARIFLSSNLLARVSYIFFYFTFSHFFVLDILLFMPISLVLSVAGCEFEKDMLMMGLQAHFLLLS